MKANHRYPHLHLNFENGTTHHDAILAIPGIRWRTKGNYFLVPHHAISPLQSLIEKQSLELTSAHWAVEGNSPKIWASWHSDLKQKGELRSFVLDGFLTPYQEQSIEHMGHLVGAHFWHSTGAGKTLSALLWALLQPGPIIIVTRAASRLQQARELERFSHLRPFVIRPITKKNQKTLNDYLEEPHQRPVIILGWESLRSHIDSLVALEPATVIFDESHRGKSSKRWQAIPLPPCPHSDPWRIIAYEKEQQKEAKRRGGFVPKPDSSSSQRVMLLPLENITSAAARLSKAAQRVCATTATPIKDRVRDLYAQLDLCEPYAWGSATTWMNRYADAKPNRFGGIDTRGSSNLGELTQRLTTITHRVDYMLTHQHLPQKRRQSVYIAPEDQCRATAGYPAELKAAAKRGPTAVLECRIAQAASKKEKAVMGLIEDHISSAHKVCIFTGRRRDVDRMGTQLQKLPFVKKKNVTIWAAHGGTSATNRQQIVDDYMNHPGPCVLVGTGEAFGESLNLQDTDAALFVQLPYTPGAIRQWEGRFCRLGQKRPVVIYYCICEDSVDEHVADILISKLGAIEKVSKDTELAQAKSVLAGTDDEEGILDSILEKMEK